MLNSKKKISCPRPIKDLKGNFINDFNLKKFSIFSFSMENQRKIGHQKIVLLLENTRKFSFNK